MDTKMTPDELREWGDSLGYGVVYTKERLKEVLYSAADAWQDCEELWLKNVEVDSVVIADLRLRLEAAEKALDRYGRHENLKCAFPEVGCTCGLAAALAGEEP